MLVPIELRREARIIENDVDSRLLLLSKCSDPTKLASTVKSNEKVPLLLDDSLANDESSVDVFERLSNEIEALMTRLEEVNNEMRSVTEGNLTNSISYTLDRHFAIYNDYRKEFNKTKTHFAETYQREKLFASSNAMANGSASNGEIRVAIPSSVSSTSSLAPKSSSEGLLAREHESLRNSEILIDEQIDVALRTRESLYNQKAALKAIQTQMTTLANRFPLINSVIQRIHMRKKRDTAILASVTGTCLFLLLLWSW